VSCAVSVETIVGLIASALMTWLALLVRQLIAAKNYQQQRDDVRLDRIDRELNDLAHTVSQIKTHMAENYVPKEDFIREIATLNTKIDHLSLQVGGDLKGLNTKIDRLFEGMRNG